MGKKKEKGKAEAKEINRSDFIRKPESIHELKGVSDISCRIGGEFFNAVTIFEPWNDEEAWQDVDDISNFTPQYPASIQRVENQSSKSVNDYLGIKPQSEVDAKGKKGGKAPTTSFNDNAEAEDGTPLPRVYVGKQEAGKELLSFRRQWSTQQLAVKSQVQAEEEAKANRENVDTESKEVDETKKDEVQNEDETEQKETGNNVEGDDVISKLDNSRDMTIPVNQAPTVNIDEPEGPEYDPLMCSAFRLVAQYARSLSLSSLGGDTVAVPYLWNSIYPQLPNGTPCYNAAGKYCVKLFVGGSWVKVKVHDVFPVSQDNVPLIASSVNALELWPSILAKAIYTVYTACGYYHTLADDPNAVSSLHAASFVSFAVHTMTGWLPGTPKNLSDIYEKESSENIVTLLEEINFGGASIISNRMIPDPDPVDVKQVYSDSGNQSPRKYTKKQLKDQLKKRLLEKENLTKRIRKRERHIIKIDSCVEKSFSEAFALVVIPKSPENEDNSLDGGNVNVTPPAAPSVHPVLALSYPDRNCDDTDVRVLVDWKVFREEAVQPTQLDVVYENSGDVNGHGNVTKESNANGPPPTSGQVHVDKSETPRVVCETPRSLRMPFNESEFPHSTPISYKWISLKALCKDNSVFIFGNDTKLRTFNVAKCGWHWKNTEENLDEKDKKGKEKRKSTTSSEVTRSPLCVPLVGMDPGLLPPKVLRLLPPSVPPPEGAAVEKNDETKGTELKCGDNEGVVSVMEGTSLDNSSVNTNPIDIEASEQALKRNFVSLSLQLQADISRPNSSSDSAADNDIQDGNQSLQSVTDGAPYVIPDDAVLLLQEIRTDDVEPLVMRLQLCKSNPLPFARATFHIPVEKLHPESNNGDVKPVLFLIRLFSNSSVEMSFHSACDISVKDVGDCWKEMGGQVLLKGGASQANYAESEQIIFRIPLQVAVPESDDNEEKKDEGVCDASEFEDSVIFFFHTENKDIFKTITLAVCDDETDSTTTSAAVGRNVFKVKRDQKPLTIIGRSYHSSQNIPEFEWKVYMLSNLPLKPPEEVMCGSVVPEHIPLHRYKGSYMPNNQLKVLGDVVTADSAAFPLSFRFSTVPCAGENSESTGEEVKGETGDLPVEDKHLAFVIRIYSLPSRTLVCELNGRNGLQYYLLKKDLVIEDTVDDGDSQTGKDKKDSKKDKKKGKSDEPPDDAVEFLFEVLIDETRMYIPAKWKLRYPYRFYQNDGVTVPDSAVTNIEKDEVVPDFSWQLDFLAGKVYQLRHDTFDLEKFAAIKNKWEDENHGRADRAAAAMAYVKAQREAKLRSGTEERKEGEDGPVNLPNICEALEKDVADEVMIARENILQFIPTVQEHVVTLEEGQNASIVDPDLINREKEIHAQELLNMEKASQDAVAELNAFSEKMRQITLDRFGIIRAQVKTNFEESIDNWSQRNSYKSNVEVRNSALAFLLEKSAEAKEKVFTETEEPVDTKKGKGKSSKKKKK